MKLVSKIFEGDVLAAARLMRGIEDEASDAVEKLGGVYLHTGRAYIEGLFQQARPPTAPALTDGKARISSGGDDGLFTD